MRLSWPMRRKPAVADPRLVVVLASEPADRQAALDAQLRHLHAVGELDQAAELLSIVTPDDVCASCEGTGARPSPTYLSTWADLSPVVCEPCAGSGQRSRSQLTR